MEASPHDRAGLLRASGRGFVALWRCRGLVFPLYLANLLTAVFALLPVYLALHRLTALRPAAGRLLHTWDLEVLAELALDNPDLMSGLTGVFLYVPIAYLLASQLLLGGVLGAVADAERPTLRRFGADAFGNLARLLWLLAWAAVPYALIGGLLLLCYGWAGESAWPLRLLALSPGLLLLAWTDAALDFARVEAVLGGRRWSVARLVVGYRVVLARPVASLGVHLGFALLGVVPLALLVLLPDSLDAGGTAALLGAFLLRQAVVFARVALRVAALGSHVVIYRSVFPPRAPAAALDS